MTLYRCDACRIDKMCAYGGGWPPLGRLLLPGLLLLLLLLPAGWMGGVGWAAHGSRVSVNLTIAVSESVNVTETFEVDEDSLKEMGATAEEIGRSLAHVDAAGRVNRITIGESEVPIHVEVKTDPGSLTYSFLTVDKHLWSVTLNNFTNVTVEDFKGDTTLTEMQVSLDWSLPPQHPPQPANLTLRSALLEVDILLDNTTLASQKTKGEVGSGQWVQVIPGSGLYLRTVNPHTHRLTLVTYFNTQDYFIDSELVDTLRNIRTGRVALLTSYYDASARLEASSRAALASLGSFAVRHLAFRDCWAWAWSAGGATLAEGLVTNMNGTSSQPPPLDLHFTLPTPPPSDRLCESWPSSWNKRQHFCDVYDGYGDLCACSYPFMPPTNTTRTDTWREDLGVMVMAGSRPRYLYRLLRQLVTQPGLDLQLVLVSVDGVQEETIKLVEVLGLRWRVHAPEGAGSPRISRHLRFALFQALDVLTVDKFIILEEDLILAPDFYSYMQQTSVLLDQDPSLFGVSAYAHFSYVHTARDPTRLNRVHSLPAYGWMVKRSFLRETLPKWPPVYVATDWDYWVGTGLVRRGRELIIPEVSRTAHAGLTGAHFSGLLTKKRFFNKPLSSDALTVLNLTTVNKKVYESEIKVLLAQAEPLNITDLDNYTIPARPGAVYAVCVRMRNPEDAASFRILAKALRVWDQDLRDHHYGLWRLPYYQAIILVIGTPYSKYSYNYLSKRCPVWSVGTGHFSHTMDNFDETYSFVGHSHLDFLKILNLSVDAQLGQLSQPYDAPRDVSNKTIHPADQANTTTTPTDCCGDERSMTSTETPLNHEPDYVGTLPDNSTQI
ncbi:protein O-linked-mannose beta-1,2-N-acetylglucosaminyltransferase 1-like [Panulirus ornatus]|uniref:protein O-linked-mannose beta-1,2-N-acetylglucosaminyltransferase 1-like n=1 Tax=Panulirus ornatus TaxID=150431 RepID=UPI003A8A1408